MVHTFKIPKYYTCQICDQTGEVKIFSDSKHAKGRELTQFLNPNGYLRVKLNDKSVQIHTIVANYFLGNKPKNLCVNHIDGNKLNNAPSNLEYVTIRENILHSIKTGLHICNKPELMPTYKDGRCKDKVEYKRNWYLANRDRILSKTKQRYNAKKAIAN
jgi:hypothetical protein